MPTFQIFKAGKKVDEVVGADIKTLGELLKKHNAASGAFTGKGRILAGNSQPRINTFQHGVILKL